MDRDPKKLDDVASSLPPAKDLELTLDEVGLENVQSQVRLHGLLLPARSQASVSLIDRRARGIHMSRLFRIINKVHEQELTWAWMNTAVDEILATHEGLSDRARLQMAFELPVLRRALVSAEQGWRNYPVTYRVEANGDQRKHTLSVRTLYSSTCPCSAGLSRQALQEQFAADFQDSDVAFERVFEWLGRPESFIATPHAQRSEALCEFTIEPDVASPATLSLIDDIEEALGTPVQAAVKRADELKFAKLNARHLMFCEDAARKLKAALLRREDVADFKIEVRHFESLHAHDVVAKVRKFD